MLKGVSKNLLKVSCLILLLLFVPLWSLFHFLLMNSSFHLSFLIVPMATVVESESKLLGILLLCNSLSRSFLIGSLGLSGLSRDWGNKRHFTHAPRIKGQSRSMVDHTVFLQGSLGLIWIVFLHHLCKMHMEFVHVCLNASLVHYLCVQESDPDSIWQDRQINRLINNSFALIMHNFTNHLLLTHIYTEAVYLPWGKLIQS